LKQLYITEQLSQANYDAITSTTRPEEILDLVNEAIIRKSLSQAGTKKRVIAVVEPLLMKLERFGAAIDMLAQSSPQVMGLNLVGLVWGFLRFIIAVSLTNG
jgi:hypothetical protein